MLEIIQPLIDELGNNRLGFVDILVYGTVGAIGALIRELSLSNNIVTLPRKWSVDGKAGVDFGVLGSMIVGSVVAIVVDHNPITAFFAAVGAPHLIELWAKRIRSYDKILRVNGSTES